MYRNVLVPLDGSPLAKQALAAAVAVRRRDEARLHLVHVRMVYRPPESDAGGTEPELAYLAGACERICGQPDQSVGYAVLTDPRPEIFIPTPSPSTVAGLIHEYASERGIDLIVMATHGGADCAVLVVRTAAAETDEAESDEGGGETTLASG
jgi:nucleotide-binding universal stress UspA family protein